MNMINKLFSKRSKTKGADNPAKSGVSSLLSRKAEFNFLSDSTKKQLSDLLEQIQVAYAPLKERLAPVIKYYNGLNKREKIIARVGGLFVLGYIVFYSVLLPYQGWRDQVIITRDAAYEEFTWLESQKERVKDAILARGGDFNAILDVNEIASKYAPSAKIEQVGNGEYIITVSESKGTGFFNIINAIVNRGGKLISVELSRASKTANANFVAKVNI